MDGLQQSVSYADPVDEISIDVRPRPWPLKRLLIGAAAVVFLAGAGMYGDYWWTTGRFMVSTDDAYVQAHSVLIRGVGLYLGGASRRQSVGPRRRDPCPDRPPRLPDRARPSACQCHSGASEHRHSQPANRSAETGGRAGPPTGR